LQVAQGRKLVVDGFMLSQEQKTMGVVWLCRLRDGQDLLLRDFFLEELAGALLYHIRRKQTGYNNLVLTLLRPHKLIKSMEIIKMIFMAVTLISPKLY
jgi:hypothetical protein